MVFSVGKALQYKNVGSAKNWGQIPSQIGEAGVTIAEYIGKGSKKVKSEDLIETDENGQNDPKIVVPEGTNGQGQNPGQIAPDRPGSVA